MVEKLSIPQTSPWLKDNHSGIKTLCGTCLPHPRDSLVDISTLKGHLASQLLSQIPVSELTGTPMLQEGDGSSPSAEWKYWELHGVQLKASPGLASIDRSSQKPNSMNSTCHWGGNGRPPPFWVLGQQVEEDRSSQLPQYFSTLASDT